MENVLWAYEGKLIADPKLVVRIIINDDERNMYCQVTKLMRMIFLPW